MKAIFGVAFLVLTTLANVASADRLAYAIFKANYGRANTEIIKYEVDGIEYKQVVHQPVHYDGAEKAERFMILIKDSTYKTPQIVEVGTIIVYFQVEIDSRQGFNGKAWAYSHGTTYAPHTSSKGVTYRQAKEFTQYLYPGDMVFRKELIWKLDYSGREIANYYTDANLQYHGTAKTDKVHYEGFKLPATIEGQIIDFNPFHNEGLEVVVLNNDLLTQYIFPKKKSRWWGRSTGYGSVPKSITAIPDTQINEYIAKIVPAGQPIPDVFAHNKLGRDVLMCLGLF